MDKNKNKYSTIFSLKDKIAFIIGGRGLIGSEIAMAIKSYGAKTIILDIDVEDNIEESDLIYQYFDCGDLSSSESNINNFVKEFGCPDILINCSYPHTKDWSKSSFKEVKLGSLQKNIDIHLNSYAWLARLTANHMVKCKINGSIIQLGSIYGVVGQNENIYEGTSLDENMIYSIIKGGIISLTRQMASYYGKNQIRINTICPGGIFDNNLEEKFIKKYSQQVPLSRLGNPSEIASTTLFLASSASSYITGATIMVDGGWTAI